MKLRLKKYFKINLMPIIFVIVSFISVTLAWFAYSGLADFQTEIDVKTWYIEIKKGEEETDDIVLSFSELYPGMKTKSELVKITNFGDSDASVNYKIVSARILGDPEDEYEVNENITSEYLEDLLSHEYPFHINLNLNKNYVLSGEENFFEASVSWPLDSGSDELDELDSLWGTKAYEFLENEKVLEEADHSYQIRPSIQIVISLVAEQYIESEESSSDFNYNLGDRILFDVVNNSKCETISSTCLETYVFDINNILGDETVTLLPNPNTLYLNSTFNNYNNSLSTLTTNWIVTSRALLAQDILKIISNDISNSLLIRNGISDLIIGNLNYENRMNTEITKAISGNGYYKFLNSEKFNFLYSNNCYWTNSEYNINNAFAVKKVDEDNLKLYNEIKTTNCNIVPVIIVNKSKL